MPVPVRCRPPRYFWNRAVPLRAPECWQTGIGVEHSPYLAGMWCGPLHYCRWLWCLSRVGLLPENQRGKKRRT
ncbi:hypothetical protein CGRA01v4_11646 [Colletotrichum graminicola]|nr:hypothetical protein CGRA01v4_11646 [Colletotrichum graminicola]